MLLNIAFALLLLLSDLSVLISPEYLWILAFMGLLFPYLLLINIGYIVYWAIKKSRKVFISLSIVLLSVSNICAYIQLPFHPFTKGNSVLKKGETQIKILSYNVKAFNEFEKPTKEGINKELLAFVKSENPDIICFQEFYIPKRKHLTIKKLLNKLEPAKYYTAVCNYTNAPNQNYGVAVFSKYPIVKKKKLEFSNTTNTSMYVDIAIKKDTIRIINNHLQSYRLQKENYEFFDTLNLSYNGKEKEAIEKISVKLRDAFKLRAHQAKHIANEIKHSPYPVIVCGDFNDTPVSYTYRTMKHNLKDAFRESGKGIGNSYIGNIPSFRIDYIFHSNDIESWKFTTYKVFHSDHFPISSYFKVRMK